MNALSPNHYKFPGGVEVRHISAYLTSFGGQALQYIARATRLDDDNKGATAQARIEDLRKTIKFATWEIERLQSEPGTPPSGIPARRESVAQMDMPFNDDELDVCNEAAELLGIPIPHAIAQLATSGARQLLDAHYYPRTVAA